jgi:hypothetical protein
VKFPSDVPTHCAEQTFFFSEKVLLRRLDYATDIAGGVGSHYCFDQETFGGLVFPTPRGRTDAFGSARIRSYRRLVADRRYRAAAEMKRCHGVKPAIFCRIKFTEWTRFDEAQNNKDAILFNDLRSFR